MGLKQFDVDLTKHEAFAKHTVTCDSCTKAIGERYPNKHEAIALSLRKNPQPDEEYPQYSDAHFCNEDCLRDHLNKRSEAKKKK